ncbi:MAG: ATP phosphoribosyltransferase [Bullifex sp.]|nr:ATP phosphoribosyltransferase [Spirochaetales bacterium]MDY5776717.1 ATP phosphoribosyltransferase [Bullifex sp.]
MKNLRIAVQKSGRLSEKSLELIRSCGIEFSEDSRVLRTFSPNFPLEFLFVRDDDIPTYVNDGVADIGIVGRNEYDEKGYDLNIVRDLGFAACRLSIAVPNDFDYRDLTSLEGKRIATSYPRITESILKKAGVNASYVTVSGSVEITPQVGIADCICDLVSTGTTLKMNGLKEVEPIYYTSAVMISRKEFEREESERYDVLKRLLVRMDTVAMAKHKKYVLFNLPKKNLNEAAAIIGGMKSPTVTPLMDPEWVSVQSVVAEDRFWSVFESLRELGAEGILVMDIEKMTE